jgi:hypothetical protein
MRLGVARLCLDCEEIHDADRCPACGSETFAFLKRWVTPASPPKARPTAEQAAPIAEHVEQMDAYQQLLRPEGQRSRKGRLITRGAAWLAVFGAARLAWRAARTARGSDSPRGG